MAGCQFLDVFQERMLISQSRAGVDAADRRAAPADFACRRRGEADEGAQQGGFAGAVLALDVQPLSRRQIEGKVGKQAAFAADAGEIGDGKHGGCHEGLNCARIAWCPPLSERWAHRRGGSESQPWRHAASAATARKFHIAKYIFSA